MTEVDVVVVGGGPAGLAAATQLRALGIGRVVLLERESVCGGAARHCGHPAFGLREMRRLLGGWEYTRRLEHKAREAGVDIRTHHTVRGVSPQLVLDVLTPDGRSRIASRRIVLATGARETPRSARLVGGERPLGVMTTGALQSYIYLEKLVPFRRPLIVGTELVGLSSLWTCRSHGIKPVAVAEMAEAPTARWPLSLFPALLGIPRHFGTEIIEIQGRPRVEKVMLRDASGEILEIACDGVLFTGQFVPEHTLARAIGLQIDGPAGTLVVDQFGRTSDPRIFAVGNGVRAVETAGWCWQEGLTIAGCVHCDLTDGLPAAGSGTIIRSGDGVRFVVPAQVWPSHALGFKTLQLRLARSVTGRLMVRSKTRLLLSQRVSSKPERRILLPTNALSSDGRDGLTVSVETTDNLLGSPLVSRHAAKAPLPERGKESSR